ncbi:MAG: hypothetical protein H6734_12335 [Alphaproteobacteria bacterium]|nr:hypothetical protein [Alphaproteobacteria bacterium]
MRVAREPVAGLLVGILAVIAVQVALQPWTLDDAYISFRYAENLARGEGLVYNPGEWVEGYTTFLWVFLLGVGNALGADTRTLAKVLGVGFALATLGLVAFASRLVRAVDAREGAVGAGLLGTCGAFAAWVMPGMEVPLVALLLTGTALACVRALEGGPVVPVGLLGATALLARPDSVVVVAVCVAAVTLVRRTPWAVVAAGGLYGPYFAWRWWAYGWLLPNTFYAKVGGTEAQVVRGLGYLGDALQVLGPLVLLGVLGLPALRERRALGVLWVAVVAHAAYVVLVGGDVMPAFRFFAGLVPVLAVLAAVGAVHHGRVGLGLAAVAMVGGMVLFERHPDLRPRIERGVVGRNGEEVGVWMRENLPADTLLATNTAGSVPYFSGFRTIDMLGLNDAHIAHREMPGMGRGNAGHEKADGAYVFARDPDVVQLGSARGRETPVFRSDRELVRQPGFATRYVPRTYVLPSGARLQLFVRRTWVEDGRAP